MKNTDKANEIKTNVYSWMAVTVSIAIIFSAILGGIASYYVIRDHRKK